MQVHERFTEDELEVLLLAWATRQKGLDFRPSDELWPESHRLTERGWLERRWNNQNGDIVFRWSHQAEAALDINNLTATAKASVN